MKSIFILIGLLLNFITTKASERIIPIDFGLLKIHQVDTQTFSISNDYKHTIQYKDAEINRDYTIISQTSIKGKSLSFWTIIFHPKKNGVVNDSFKLFFQYGNKEITYTLNIKANVVELLQNRMFTLGQDYTILIDSAGIDLDTITEGEQVSYKVRFRNVGSQAISIKNHSTSCGCDQISYSTEPVPSGAYGFFYYHYNSTVRWGEFIKSATVEFPNQHISMQFKGFVKAR